MPNTNQETIYQRIAERITIDENGCWIWNGAKIPAGYGHIRIKGRDKYTHIVMFELTKGDIPAGLELDHLCRNRACCNPEHLEAVTHKVNINRGSRNHGKRFRKIILVNGIPVPICKNGHLLTPDNVISENRGTKTRCLICRRKSKRESAKRIYDKLKSVKLGEPPQEGG